MKLPIKSLIIFTLIIASFVFGLNTNTSYPVLEPDKFVSPDKDGVAYNTNIYFVYENALRSENRKVKIYNNEFEKAIIQAIKDGPKNTKYSSIFDYGIDVLSVEYINNTCYLNISEELLESELWKSDSLDLYIWSLVNSLTEVKRVFNVQLLVNGERIERKLLGFSLQSPVKRVDGLNYLKERMPSDVVIDFIDLLNSSRLDLAYEMTTQNFRQNFDFFDFVTYADEFNEEVKGFNRDLYYTKVYSDRWVIYVKFVKNVDSLQYQSHFYKLWTVVQVDGNYQIELLNK